MFRNNRNFDEVEEYKRRNASHYIQDPRFIRTDFDNNSNSKTSTTIKEKPSNFNKTKKRMNKSKNKNKNTTYSKDDNSANKKKKTNPFVVLFVSLMFIFGIFSDDIIDFAQDTFDSFISQQSYNNNNDNYNTFDDSNYDLSLSRYVIEPQEISTQEFIQLSRQASDNIIRFEMNTISNGDYNVPFKIYEIDLRRDFDDDFGYMYTCLINNLHQTYQETIVCDKNYFELEEIKNSSKFPQGFIEDLEYYLEANFLNDLFYYLYSFSETDGYIYYINGFFYSSDVIARIIEWYENDGEF